MRGFRIVVAAFAVVIAGCNVNNLWRDDVERINEAFPPAQNVEAARLRLAEISRLVGAAEASAFDLEYSRRVASRALECAKGEKLSTFDSKEDLRGRLDRNCFITADSTLLAWVQTQRLVLTMRLPPMSEIPNAPPKFIAAGERAQLIEFAQAAPVLGSIGRGRLEIVDFAQSKTLFSEDLPVGNRSLRIAMAPNGRAFALGDDGGSTVRDSVTGENLATYGGYTNFQWLDPNTALLKNRTTNSVAILDFASGQLERTSALGGANSTVVPISSARQFLAFDQIRAIRFELQRDKDGVRAHIVDQRTMSMPIRSPGPLILTSDEKYAAIATDDSLMLLEVETMLPIPIELPGFSVQLVSPLEAPGELLLTGTVNYEDFRQRQYVFKIDDHSMAPVDDARLTSPNARVSLIQRLPLFKEVYLRTDNTFSLAGNLQRGGIYREGALAAHFAELVEERRRTRPVPADAMYGGQGRGTYAGSANPALGDLVKDAQVHAVGAYESASAPTTYYGQKEVPSPIDVIVRRGDAPLVLVVSSYDPVIWRITVLPGARLKAILLGGSEESKVFGAGDVRVVDMGRVYSYEQNGEEYRKLNAEVLRWTGKPINSLQGRYKANTFTVASF